MKHWLRPFHCTALAIALTCASFLSSGCSTPPRRNWSDYEGPGREHFVAEEVEFPFVPDPLEPVNRGISGFNHILLTGLVQPVSWLYRSVTPQPLRTGLRNVFDNAYYPVRLVNNVLQGKWDGAWRETQRFATNTTVGVLGLNDPALRWGITPSPEDFGQTLGRWGWRSSSFFVLPFYGPATLRDGLGQLGDSAADPLSFVPNATTVRTGQFLLSNYPHYERFVDTGFDPYELARLLFVIGRELQIDDYEFAPTKEELSAEAETLGIVFLAPEEEFFPGRSKALEVTVPATEKELPYNVWLQDEPSPLVYILPGTAGHRMGSSTTALAEVAFSDGNSVVTISSALNFEFIEAGLSASVPGFAPNDAKDVHEVLDTIDRDLERRYPGHFTDRVLAGMSLGAFHTLYIAARESDSGHGLLSFDAYVALNSPVSFEHAVSQLDSFYNTALQLPKEERGPWMTSTLRKVVHLAGGSLKPTSEVPFTQDESRFIIGLSFRQSLGDVVYLSQRRVDWPVLHSHTSGWNRTLTFREAYDVSFREFVYAYALPYYAALRDDVDHTEEGFQRILRLCDLRSIKTELIANEKIFFFSNRNDFLLNAGDIEFAQDVFGDRTVIFERGGHLGNLHLKDVRRAIKASVERIFPDSAEPESNTSR